MDAPFSVYGLGRADFSVTVMAVLGDCGTSRYTVPLFSFVSAGGSIYCVRVSARLRVERRWLRGGIARLKGLETLRFEEEARHSDRYEQIDCVFGVG